MNTTLTQTCRHARRLAGTVVTQTLAGLVLLAGCQTIEDPLDMAKQKQTPPGDQQTPPGDQQPPPGNPPSRALPTLTVDPAVAMSAHILPPHDDGSPRPVAVATDKSNKPVEFVEDELIVVTDDMLALDAFMRRWNGVLLETFDPLKYDMEGEQVHLIRVKTDGADRARLQANLMALDANSGSELRVGSESGANLIAAAAQEAAGGLTIGINFVHNDAGARERTIREAPTGDALVGKDNKFVENYSPDPYNWTYMKVGGNQNMGVAEAWNILARAGKLNNKVKICIVDGGFADGTEYPDVRTHNNATLNAVDPTQANQVECTGGSSCPWHGMNVVEACMGRMDNGIGAVGPAAPVATLLTIRRSGDIFNNIHAIGAALFSGANIINMSFHARVPASLSWAVTPFSVATKRARDAGKLIFASAGNDGENIDAEDCFVFCWEEAWHTPVENGGVIGVGALDLNATNRRSDSNYGTDELDIWGPGFMWVGPDPAIQRVHSFGATSGASPFVAGIAALVWAANPALNNEQVWQILWETCNIGSSGEASRWPNAAAAVIRALGNCPPDLWNVKVERKGFTGNEVSCTCEAADCEDGVPVVTWTSDRLGYIGSGTQVAIDLPFGRNVITCTAKDRKGVALTETRVYEMVNAPPRVLIQEPVDGLSCYAGQMLFFQGWSTDLEIGKALPDASLTWASSRDGILGTGHSLQAALRTVGYHQISLTGVDYARLSATINIEVWVQAPPPDGLPPTAGIYKFDYDPTKPQIEPGTGRLYIDLNMSGVGHDAEDGYLEGDYLTWTLDAPGSSWSLPAPVHGRNVYVRLYPSGSNSEFRVILTATDKNGKTGFAVKKGQVNFIR